MKSRVLLSAVFLPIFLASAQAQSPAPAAQLQTAKQNLIVKGYGKLPLSFEANQGQTDARVKFLSRGAGYALFLTSDEAVFSLRGNKAKDDASGVGRQSPPSPAIPATSAVLRMKLVKANRAAKVTGTDELPGTNNYFIGNDPKKWSSNVAQYAKVKYEGVYPGIDLVYYGNQRQLEYDFVVAPGADPRRIRLKLHGAGKLRIDKKGDLLLAAEGGQVRLQKPQVYQQVGGTRKAVEGGYWMAGANTIGFRVADYDHSRPLVIDPVLVYSTYLGGSANDFAQCIAVDSAGNAYVAGFTYSADFPTVNAISSYGGGTWDEVFVTKINASGTALVYSTYLGGIYQDYAGGIAVDSAGNAYVTGAATPADATTPADFPTVNAIQSSFGGGDSDAFVAKINASGTALVYSTYLGGSGHDQGYGIAVDSAGNAYVAGQTYSADFPTVNAIQSSSGGGPYDAFVSKIGSIGSDNAPPTTTAIPSPGPNSYGWNSTNVTVNLSATDNAGGSGVKQIEFALSGAQNTGSQTMAGNSASITISAEGTTIFSYFATDNAGNVEVANTLTVRIDKTAPIISGLPALGCTLWPPNNKLVQVATVTAADALSGLAPGSFSVTGVSNDPANGEILITGGPSQFNIKLRSGKGLIYTLTATASDLAGNTATEQVSCAVQHDKGK
jgi:Beta-propeller repeat